MSGSVSARVAELIASLGLEPHPEGGHFAEVHRSAQVVSRADGARRSALTTIYFLLAAGEASRWHAVSSDEVWHFYEGAPLRLYLMDAEFVSVDEQMLGAYGAGTRPVRTVPAGTWQAARSTGAYTLVGCTVGPGFDFADFRMLRANPQDAALVVRRHERFASLV